VTNRGKEVEAGTDRETNRDDWKVTPSRSPLKVMFSGNNVIN
jgi:hypothetical protein